MMKVIFFNHEKNIITSQGWWFKSAILATWEAEIRRIAV
jgi:hypothetical protein